MAIFYTAHEGGRVQKFPKTPAHWWAIEQLEQNISTHKYSKEEMTNNVFDSVEFPIKMNCSYLCGIRVHSVFFTVGSDLYRVWDSSSSISGHRRVYLFGAMQSAFKDYIKNKKWLNSNQ